MEGGEHRIIFVGGGGRIAIEGGKKGEKKRIRDCRRRCKRQLRLQVGDGSENPQT